MSDRVPEGWEKKRLGEVGQVVTGSTPKTIEPLYWGGDIQFVSPADFELSVYLKTTSRHLTKLGAEKGRLLPKDAILVTCIGSLGGIKMSSKICVTNQQINAIIPNNNFDNKYCYYNVLFHIAELEKNAGTTTLPIINKSTFEGIVLPFPPLPEQQKIASILTAVDDVIEKTQAQINKLQDLKKATMNELLTKGIGHTEFKDSAVGKIPKEWDVKKLGEIMDLNYGKSPKGITSKDGEYPIFGTGGLTGFGTEYLYDGETVIIGRKGTIDMPQFVNGRFWAIDTTYYCSFFKNILPKYFFYSLVLKDLRKYNDATGVPSLSRDVLREISIKLPPLHEQQKIASILTSIDTTIEQKQRKFSQVQSLKKALMSDLLTGKVRVKLN